jgi:hypothetical protein
MYTIAGRTFSAEILAKISRTLKAEPAISRRELSRRVCEWMDWHSVSGRWQEMSCRKALLELHRRHVIELPPVRKRYAFQGTRPAPAPPPLAVVNASLRQLGEVELLRVSGSEPSALWRGMMDAHHYLGSGPLCGAQLRYLIRSSRYGWLGGLSYSACARRVECRDAWIGWPEPCRRRNHHLVVNNSRFLIVPSVQVKYLASHVLAKCQARIGQDWQSRYAYRPVLLETYVERGRFTGSCYRAANWIHLGSSGGRGRDGQGASIKDIYVAPLAADWQSVLCRDGHGRVQLRQPPAVATPRDWIEEELRNVELGDQRLTARLLQMTGMFYARPTANIPQASGSAKAAKAAYRFLDNEKVDWQAILQAHYRSTEERFHKERLVLVAQDTTTLNYSTHPHTQGLGPIGTDSEKVRGLIVHDTMSFTPRGTPLGLVDVQCWAREQIGSRHQRYHKPIEQKESFKWVESYRQVSAIQNRCRKTRLVLMADRECDIHEVFAEQAGTVHGAQLLIRAERSRHRKAIDEEDNCEFLWPMLQRQAPVGTREILVPPNEKRTARQAVLEVRTMPVVLRAPKRKAHLPNVQVWAVLASEIHVPEGVEALEWMLLSTVPVKDEEDAYERLQWYARRWGIEIYHRILKSGCRIEARQLETATRLRNCLAIDMIVAWRIQHLTFLGQETPKVPCTVYFSDSEWKALCTFVNKTKQPPEQPPDLNEAVGLLGRLGGHLARKGDGDPGSEVLWRGMARLADLETAYDLYH